MSLANRHVTLRARSLLNGWWDIQPVLHENLSIPLAPATVPHGGWAEQVYLVPGFFTDHPYPADWRESRSAWVRTRFSVVAKEEEQRAYLHLQAAIPQALIFVNGRHIATQDDMFIGDEYDITDVLQVGENELAIFLTEFHTYPHPDTGKPLLIDVPWGCCIAHEQAGIWQDVVLEWRAPVHVADVTIRTSVREGTLRVAAHVVNAGSTRFVGTLQHVVDDHEEVRLTLPTADIVLEPGETCSIEQTIPWSDYHPWSPEDPYLYHLRTEVYTGEYVTDITRTRFGFREIWIEGHRILLNGRPQRWRGEWCHKSHSHWLRPEYVRQWYRQIKDLNANYVRMHTFPHPEYFLDIADEMGILVCQESALHGSGQSGYESADLWQRARAHVQHMVRRDKNHPSLVLWSVENEMRWALNLLPGAKEQLPLLRALFNKLDPTRPAYHDGDSALWNEDEQAIISRHYGAACHGLGWWDRCRPLHAGEVGRWHYGSPHVALQWAGDEIYTDYALVSRSMALDAARIIELGRANEVSVLFPWNTSGLDNFRPGEARTFTWPDPNTPYLKPLAHTPYESEYAWWEDGAGYRPGYSFAVLQRAFRPLAIVVREERTQCYTDRRLPHTVYLVNDLPETVQGTLVICLEQAGKLLWKESHCLTVESGYTGMVACHVPLQQARDGVAVIVTSFQCAQGDDVVRRSVHVCLPEVRDEQLALPQVALWGSSDLYPWLKQHDVAVTRVDEETLLDPAVTPILIIAEKTVMPDSVQHRRVREFLLAGGHVLVLEQAHSLFPGVSIERRPIEMAHIRAAEHPVMSGIRQEELRFFGDDPFGLPSSDAWVTLYPYVKPIDNHLIFPLVDSSAGDFSDGGLTWAPVIEAHIGPGVLIASQLRLSDRWAELPVADRFLRNALHYLADYETEPSLLLGVDDVMAQQIPAALLAATELRMEAVSTANTPVSMVAGTAIPVIQADTMTARLNDGETVIVWGVTEDTRAYWEQVIGQHIELWTLEHAVYHLIATGKTALLTGISNEDTCWLDNYTYRWNVHNEVIVAQLLTIPVAAVYLQNADRAGLDVLFGDELASEWKRMPALSRFFDAPAPRVGGALVEVAVGEGRVIFCQLNWRPDLWRFRRFLGLLLWNLGINTATDILDGDCTPTSGRRSDGYPAQIRVVRELTAELLDELLALAKRRVEYCGDNATFRQWPCWHVVDTPGGCLTAAQVDGQGMLAFGMEINCPEPRKFMQTVGGWPNPDLQTSLRLQGGGVVRAWVNGAERSEYPLTPDHPVYIADIDFEAGANFIVLTWEPDTAEAQLAWCFEDRNRRPETSFAFG